MNILFVIHYPVFGGPHNQALLLAHELGRKGVSMTVLLPDEPGNAAARFRAAGVDVVTIPLHRLRATPHPLPQLRLLAHLPREVGKIRDLIQERGIDVVQIGGLVNPHGAIAGRLERAAIVWQLLDTRPPLPLRRLLMPLVTRLSDVVMTTGKTVGDVHPGAAAMGDGLRTFFPPVDVDRFTPENVDRDAARAHFGLRSEDIVLGNVGNLNPQKGHEYLLRAAALVRRKRPETKLLVVGASHATHRAYEDRLYRLARELGFVTGRDVIFAGDLVDVRPGLAAMDIFVLSSVPRSEGAPTVVEEAMTMMLPVVACDVGAVAEVVDDGVTGHLVPPLDPDAISRAVLHIIDTPSVREAMARAARDRAVARFSIEECARIHMEAYEYALRRSRGRDGHRHSRRG